MSQVFSLAFLCFILMCWFSLFSVSFEYSHYSHLLTKKRSLWRDQWSSDQRRIWYSWPSSSSQLTSCLVMSSTLAVFLPLHGGETGDQGEEVTREKMGGVGSGQHQGSQGRSWIQLWGCRLWWWGWCSLRHQGPILTWTHWQMLPETASWFLLS